MTIIKILLLFLATWRMFRILAIDKGPKCIFLRMRKCLGVEYNGDHTEWSTNDGSLAEMITCCNCAPVWIGLILTLVLLFAPDWIYLLITLPLNASAATMVLENKFYSK